MGMFDSIYGNVKCPSCGELNGIEIQFKWGSCLLLSYELGDYISSADETGYDTVSDYSIKCRNCESLIYPTAVLRNQKIISILNQEEMESTNFDDLPDIEDRYAKKEKYRKDVRNSLGKTMEYTSFNNHPKFKEDKIIALEKEWVLKEGYIKRVNDSDPKKAALIRLRGLLNRNSDYWYVYKVYNKDVGERWLEVTHSVGNYRSYRKGNMELLKEIDLMSDMYVFEQVF